MHATLFKQVGVTPEGTELPRAARDEAVRAEIAAQAAEHRAMAPAGADPKWRFMWRIGDRPAATSYWELNAEPVIPAGGLRVFAQARSRHRSRGT